MMTTEHRQPAMPADTGLNATWLIDSCPTDVLLTPGDGRPGVRVALHVLIDRYSRRMLVSVTPGPSDASALALVHRGIEAWGTPEEIRTDLWADLRSAQRATTLAALGIHRGMVRPYTLYQKPLVERAIRTVLAVLPGLATRAVARLQARIDQWAECTYAHAPQPGLDGKSPAEMASEWQGHAARAGNPQA